MIDGGWRTLLLAMATFNPGFVIWFSFVPFTGGIADEFELSVAELGIVASAAIVAVPLGRILIGPLTDRYGARSGWSGFRPVTPDERPRPFRPGSTVKEATLRAVCGSEPRTDW